jgi:hypothetical protein
MSAFVKVCDHATTCFVGDDMHHHRASAEDLAALRDAVLRCHDDLLRLLHRRSLQVMRRLRRLHLAWLVAPWTLIDLARTVLFFGQRSAVLASQQQAVGLYRRLSGKDPQVARAEVWRIVGQLTPLDERVRRLDGDRPGAPRGADSKELAAAAAALVGYHLAERRTDDELLREVEAAWAEHEDLAEQRRQRGVERGRRGRRSAAPTIERREQAATDRYLVAWRRWLDRQAQHGASVGSTDS